MAFERFFRGDRDRDRRDDERERERWRSDWRDDDRYRRDQGSEMNREYREAARYSPYAGGTDYGHREDFGQQRYGRNQPGREDDRYTQQGSEYRHMGPSGWRNEDVNVGGRRWGNLDQFSGGYGADITGRSDFNRGDIGGGLGSSARFERGRDIAADARFGVGSRNAEHMGQHRGRGPKGWRRSDERIREDICECLADDPYIDASNVEVTVKDCEVTLAGSVNSREEKRRAEDLIERLSGVKDVHNQLRVQRQENVAQNASDQRTGGSETMRH